MLGSMQGGGVLVPGGRRPAGLTPVSAAGSVLPAPSHSTGITPPLPCARAPRRKDSQARSLRQVAALQQVQRSTSSQPSPVSALSSVPKTPRSSSSSWLAEAVPLIVRSCVGVSLLHVVRRTAASALDVQAYPVPEGAEGSLEYWKQCAHQARLSEAEGFVLVRPVASPTSCYWSPNGCSEACPASSSAFAGQHTLIPHPGHPHQAASAAAPLRPPGSSSPQDAARSLGDVDAGRPGEFGTSYYGVVVQTCGGSGGASPGLPDDSRPSSDGCFLLKLCRAAGAGAAAGSCMHYSMTRLCQGQPLHSQLYGSWLATA